MEFKKKPWLAGAQQVQLTVETVYGEPFDFETFGDLWDYRGSVMVEVTWGRGKTKSERVWLLICHGDEEGNLTATPEEVEFLKQMGGYLSCCFPSAAARRHPGVSVLWEGDEVKSFMLHRSGQLWDYSGYRDDLQEDDEVVHWEDQQARREARRQARREARREAHFPADRGHRSGYKPPKR